MSPMRSGSSPSMPRRESTLWRSWGEATTSSPGRRRIQSSSTDVCSNPVDSGQMGCICWKVNASSSLCGWPFGHHKGHRGRTEKNGMSSRRHVEHHGLPHCHKQSSPCKFSGVDRSQVADTRENRGGWGSRVQSCRARYAAGWLLEAKRHQQEEPQNTDREGHGYGLWRQWYLYGDPSSASSTWPYIQSSHTLRIAASGQNRLHTQCHGWEHFFQETRLE